MQNKRVAALWAAGLVGRSEHFKSERLERGETALPYVVSIHDLYSYRMLIGRRWTVRGPFGTNYTLFWINGEKVSVTTSRHQNLARYAMSRSAPWIGDGVGSNPALLATLHALIQRDAEEGLREFPPFSWVGPLADWLLEQERESA